MVVAFLQIFHHCQLLCISVGKSANAGWVGSQKIPIVPGWLGKCTGLQNTCTNFTVKGPKGEMSQYVNPAINVAIEDGHVTLTENDKEMLDNPKQKMCIRDRCW